MSKHENHDHNGHGEVTVETLSTPLLRVKPAPLGRRVGAGVVDSFIIGLVWGILAVLFRQDVRTATQNFWLWTSLALLAFLYYSALEWFFSATGGKSLLKLIVLDTDGDPCSLGASLKRNLFRFIDWLPALYVLAAVVVLVTPNRQRIGDIIASTIVTKAPEKDINPPPAPFLFH
jgi:uncharacterized RDD family membrane protein YckC